MTYIEFLQKSLFEFPTGVPIYTSELSKKLATSFSLPPQKAAAATAVVINRIKNSETNCELRCFQKGIYYRTAQTPFGEIGINKEIVIRDKYLANDSGYDTGTGLLYRLGLTTQIPAKRTIATNKANECIREDKSLDVFLKPPKTKINKKNKTYLQILDAINELEQAPIDIPQHLSLLAGFIEKNQMDYKYLLALASKYYNKKTVLLLAQIAQEER